MSPAGLAWTATARGALRRALVALAALLVAACAVATLLVVRGTERSLDLALEWLAADIVVVPMGAQASVEQALLIDGRVSTWMPDDNVQRIAAIPGVASVSPQLYLTTLEHSSSSVPDMLLVAYDPATAYSLRPWLTRHAPRGLELGVAIGGSRVAALDSDRAIWLYGTLVRLDGNLERTGTNLDRSLFFTIETAHDIARRSYLAAERPLEIPLSGISAALVRVRPGSDPHEVALEIMRRVPNVAPLERGDLFRSFHSRALGLRRGAVAVVGAAGVALCGLLFLLATVARERHRGLGAWRARLAAVALPALSGGALGLAPGSLAAYLLRDRIVATLGLPLLLPSLRPLLAVSGAGLALALGTAALAVWPVVRAHRQKRALDACTRGLP